MRILQNRFLLWFSLLKQLMSWATYYTRKYIHNQINKLEISVINVGQFIKRLFMVHLSWRIPFIVGSKSLMAFTGNSLYCVTELRHYTITHACNNLIGFGHFRVFTHPIFSITAGHCNKHSIHVLGVIFLKWKFRHFAFSFYLGRTPCFSGIYGSDDEKLWHNFPIPAQSSLYPTEKLVRGRHILGQLWISLRWLVSVPGRRDARRDR